MGALFAARRELRAASFNSAARACWRRSLAITAALVRTDDGTCASSGTAWSAASCSTSRLRAPARAAIDLDFTFRDGKERTIAARHARAVWTA